MNTNISLLSFKNCRYLFKNLSKFSTIAQSQINNNKSKHLSHNIYKNLFKWRTELQLAQDLTSRVVYNDNNLIAICKPWGLGIHKAQIELDKNNPSYHEEILNSQIFGQPKFCVADVLYLLAKLLNLPELYIIKPLHRKWSGLLLLSTSKNISPLIEKSIRRAKTNQIPYMKFYCIVNGIPNGKLGEPYKERCGIRLTEIEEEGKLKEPIYVAPNEMSNKMRKCGTHRSTKFVLGPVKSAFVQYRILAKNSELSTSLIELGTTATKWSLIQCFLAYKTSFVLGDKFFSYRVKHILGQPITMASLKGKRLSNWNHLDPSFEPLSKQVSRALGVRSNHEIPLMIHHYGVIYPSLLQSLKKLNNNKKILNPPMKLITTDANDLVIEANALDQLPEYFVQTLDRLNLNIFRQ